MFIIHFYSFIHVGDGINQIKAKRKRQTLSLNLIYNNALQASTMTTRWKDNNNTVDCSLCYYFERSILLVMRPKWLDRKSLKWIWNCKLCMWEYNITIERCSISLSCGIYDVFLIYIYFSARNNNRISRNYIDFTLIEFYLMLINNFWQPPDRWLYIRRLLLL